MSLLRAGARLAARPSALARPQLLPTAFVAVSSGERTSFQLARPSGIRLLTKDATAAPTGANRPQRALLYIPCSDPKKLKKSVTSKADVVILDLEDSVATHQKGAARAACYDALQASKPGGSRKFVRINSGAMGEEDLELVLKSPQLEGIVVPKVNSPADVHAVERCIDKYGLEDRKESLGIVASIESPIALLRLSEIATSSKRVESLLFAAEDYCASSNIIRTERLDELLYVRSKIVAHARAFGLKSIDLVCTAYKDLDYLERECRQGRELGFDGKQAIHPAQVERIQQTFVPTEKEIARAQAILTQYEAASAKGQGAYGLTDATGTFMIDAPMLLQANAVLAQARAAGLEIPEVSSS